MSYRMNQLTALLGCAALALSFTACGAASSDSTQSTAAVEQLMDAVDQFTERDLDASYEESETVEITLADGASTCEDSSVKIDGDTITITQEGTYVISGSLSQGQILVDAEDAKVQLVLNGVTISNETSAALYAENGDKVFLTLVDGTENSLSTTGSFDQDSDVDGAIYADCDLTINGNGSLTVDSQEGHGIVSKKDLKLVSGSIDVTAAGHALSGKNSVRIADGSYKLTAGKDGIHSENEDQEKGYIYMATGSLTIESQGDGLDASGYVQIVDGSLTITAGGGAENASQKTQDFPGGGKGNFAPFSSNSDGEDETGDSGAVVATASTSLVATSDAETNEDAEVSDDVATGEDEDSEDSTVDSCKGIKSDLALYILGGDFTIDSADDALHSNGSLTLEGGSLSLSSGDDGMHADEDLTINDGEITVSQSYEGIEGATITINAGTIEVTASDDGLNAAGGSDSSQSFGFFGGDSFGQGSDDYVITMNGGKLTVDADGDGLDSNGNLEINGGTIYVAGPSDNGNAAVDWELSGTINGGTLIAVGGSGMAENFGSDSSQASILDCLDSACSDTVTITDADGQVLASFSPDKSYTSVLYSSPDLTVGQTYTFSCGDSDTEISLSDAQTTNGSAGSMTNPGNMTMPDNSDGSTPSMPDNSDGNMPTMPDNSDGSMPTMPDNSDGSMPTMPDNSDGSMPTMPDNSDGTAPTKPGNGNGKGGNGQTAPNQTNENTSSTDASTT